MLKQVKLSEAQANHRILNYITKIQTLKKMKINVEAMKE